LNARIGRSGLPIEYLLKAWVVALMAAGIARGILVLSAGHLQRILLAAVVLGIYGSLYFLGMYLWDIPEAKSLFARVSRIRGQNP
jgi:ABC-type cobalamin transport system ATPase subunit